MRFRPAPHLVVELGGEHHFVAPPLERAADDLLAAAERVLVGGVDEVDPGVERAMHHPVALALVGVAPLAEHHRAEAELADDDAGATERAVSHSSSLGRTERRPGTAPTCAVPGLSCFLRLFTYRARSASCRCRARRPSSCPAPTRAAGPCSTPSGRRACRTSGLPDTRSAIRRAVCTPKPPTLVLVTYCDSKFHVASWRPYGNAAPWLRGRGQMRHPLHALHLVGDAEGERLQVGPHEVGDGRAVLVVEGRVELHHAVRSLDPELLRA